MTTGRINQVRTIGGARARWGPHPGGRGGGRPHAGPLALRRWARGLSPVQAASDARARLPTPRRSGPRAGPGAQLPMRCGPRERSLASPRPAPPSASARSRQLRTLGRISPCLRGARLGPGRGPSCPCGVDPRALARQPPACAVLAWPDCVPASFWFTRSERRRLHASSCGGPFGTVRLRTATRMKACDPSATASALLLGQPPPRKDTSRLRGGHRSPHAPGLSQCDGAPAPGYAGPRPAAGQGLAPSACGAGSLAAARGPATVRFAC